MVSRSIVLNQQSAHKLRSSSTFTRIRGHFPGEHRWPPGRSVATARRLLRRTAGQKLRGQRSTCQKNFAEDVSASFVSTSISESC